MFDKSSSKTSSPLRMILRVSIIHTSLLSVIHKHFIPCFRWPAFTFVQSSLCCVLHDQSILSYWYGAETRTSSPKGNDAHLTVIIQSEKKWKHQFFRSLRAANSAVLGRTWPNFKLIQALMYVIITCKYEKDPIKNNREKEATPFFKL